MDFNNENTPNQILEQEDIGIITPCKKIMEYRDFTA